jgi:hypothetical protein
MRLSALKHLVEAVQALARSERICVLGSSALLGSFPELGEAGGPLEMSFDGDLLLEPCDEQLAALLHEAVGEGSLFAQRSGYHADILRAEIVETLPPGWESRLLPLAPAAHALALAPEDLLVVKLRVGRVKDLELCRAIFQRGLISPAIVKTRLDATPMAEKEIVIVYKRLRDISA